VFKHVKFADLPVSDQDRAVAFYRDKVGLRVETDAAYGEGWRWIELAIPGAQTRILLSKRDDETSGTEPSLILVTEDLDGAYARLAEQGVVFTQPPTNAPWAPGERYATMRDSEGNLVLLGTG
jgi:predicted enzyme related to lactoylglutathione lyase